MCINLFDFIYRGKEGVESHLYLLGSSVFKIPFSFTSNYKDGKNYWIIQICVPLLFVWEISRYQAETKIEDHLIDK